MEIFKEIKDQQKIHLSLLNGKQEQYLLIKKMKSLIKEQYNIDFPNDPYKQLELAISAIFKSWMRNRAVEYRCQYEITKEIADGTALIVSEMVFDDIGKYYYYMSYLIKNSTIGLSYLYCAVFTFYPFVILTDENNAHKVEYHPVNPSSNVLILYPFLCSIKVTIPDLLPWGHMVTISLSFGISFKELEI